MARTIEQCIAEFPNVDGILRKLVDAGFTSLGGHHGGSGWKIIGSGHFDHERDVFVVTANHRIAFVDHWGGAWAEPLPGEQSYTEYQAKAKAEGAVSLTEVLAVAERCRR